MTRLEKIPFYPRHLVLFFCEGLSEAVMQEPTPRLRELATEGAVTSLVFPGPKKKKPGARALEFFDLTFRDALVDAGFRVFLECNFDAIKTRAYKASFQRDGKKTEILDRFDLGTECVSTFAKHARTGAKVAVVVQDAELLEPFPFVKSRAHYSPNLLSLDALRKQAFVLAPEVPKDLQKMFFSRKKLPTFAAIKKHFALLKRNAPLEPFFRRAVQFYENERLCPLLDGLLQTGHLEDTLFVLISTEATLGPEDVETPVIIWSRGHKLLREARFRKLSPERLKTVILSLMSGKLEPGLIEWISLRRD